MDNTTIKQTLKAKYEELFGTSENATFFFSPGRVNLIGEHTDYNGGHVFPCALTIGTYALCEKRNDDAVKMYSLNMEKDGLIEEKITDITYKKENGWTNYVLGMVKTFEEKGYKIPNGFNMVVWGNIPVSSGLSSSASMEVLTGFVLKTLFDLDVSNKDIALYGQYDENHFIGVNCGIMDQFIIAMGEKDHALFLDTATLEYQKVPVHLKNYDLVIMNTNKPRGLVDSKYNERRSECEEALADLQQVLPIKSLGDMSSDQFEEYKHNIKREVCQKRAKHAVYENERTIKAVDYLVNDDILNFAKLVNESGDSLREDYEVTGIELDTLVSAARKAKGTIAARMTGAGFGGCAIAIVNHDDVNSFEESVKQEYEKVIGYAPSFYVAEVGTGPVVL